MNNQIIAKDSVYLYVDENFARMRKTYSYKLELENKSFPVPENFTILEDENSHSSGNSSRFTGQINAPRMDGSIGPLRGARVEFYFPDWPYNRVVYTDSDGRYDSGWIPDSPYVNQFVLATTQDDHGVYVVNSVGNLYADVRRIDGPFSNASYDVGTWALTGDFWRIYDAIVEGWSFLHDQVGYDMRQVKVEWPSGTNPDSTLPPNKIIDLPETAIWQNLPNHPDIILHEYGHLVMGDVYGAETYNQIANNPVQWNLLMQWAERWADFFSISARNDSHVADAVQGVGFTGVVFDYEVGGRYSETAALWDLFDVSDDGLDRISLGFKPVWDVFKNSRPTTFRNFWDAFRTANAANPERVRRASKALFQNTIDYAAASYNSTPSIELKVSSANPVRLNARVVEPDAEDWPYDNVTFQYSYNKVDWVTIGTVPTPTYPYPANPSIMNFDVVWTPPTPMPPFVRATVTDGMESSSHTARIYDFSMAGDHNASEGVGENPASWYGATPANYASMASSDDEWWATSRATTAGDYDTQKYQFRIWEDPGAISKIDAQWEGHGESVEGYDTTLLAWNGAASGWENLATRSPMGSDGWLEKTLSNARSYILPNDGRLTLMARAKNWIGVEPPPPPPPPGDGGQPAQGDFNVSVSPSSDTVVQGWYTFTTVTVTSNNYSGTVTLSATGQPSGASVSFSPSSGSSSFSSTMTISTPSSASGGIYNITITGTGSDGKVRGTTFALTVNPTLTYYSATILVTGGNRTPLPGASVYVDDVYRGTTSSSADMYGKLEIPMVLSGWHRFRAEKSGYPSEEVKIKVLSNGSWEISLASLLTDYVRVVVYEAPTLNVGEGVSDIILQDTIRKFTVPVNEGGDVRIWTDWPGSDLDLHVWGPQGRHVGWNYDTDSLDLQIPNAEYSGRSRKPEWVKVRSPQPGNWRVEVHGYAVEDVMTYELKVYNDINFPPAENANWAKVAM
ncbi:MAG: hypothetical protein AB1305_02855 [Candidatus Hadarchaeota archaeon]